MALKAFYILTVFQDQGGSYEIIIHPFSKKGTLPQSYSPGFREGNVKLMLIIYVSRIRLQNKSTQKKRDGCIYILFLPPSPLVPFLSSPEIQTVSFSAESGTEIRSES